MVNLGKGCDSRLAASLSESLFDRHAWWYSFDVIHVRTFQLFDKLARVSRHAIQKAALTLGEKNIEGQARLSRTTQARYHDDLFVW